MKVFIKRHKRALAFYGTLLALGVLLYIIAHDYATQQRGYVAYGGECVFLGLPLWGLIAQAIIADLVRDIRAPKGTCETCGCFQASEFMPWGDCEKQALPMASYDGCARWKKEGRNYGNKNCARKSG